MTNKPKTLFQKIWDSHVVTEQADASDHATTTRPTKFE